MFAVGDKFAEVWEGVTFNDCLREVVEITESYVEIRYFVPDASRDVSVICTFSHKFVEGQITHGLWVKV